MAAEWRLKALAGSQKMEGPHWARVWRPPIDYQDLHYYAAPKAESGTRPLDEVDPELLATYENSASP